MPIRSIILVLTFSLVSTSAHADEAAIIKSLKEKGAEIAETKGVANSLTIADGSKLTEADFKAIAQLTHLKSLQVSKCLNDQTLALLSSLTEVENIQTNLIEISDEGTKHFAQFKKLKNLKFFHLPKTFTGTGLAALAELPSLDSLTVAGSFAFGDEGMAAVGKLTQLKNFRTWHAGQTDEGFKKLKDLKNLKSLTIGQRLTYKAPACPSDATLAVLAEIKSLDTLQISEARLTLGGLNKLKQLPELKSLTLEGIDLSETDVETLKKDFPKVAIKWTKPNETYMKRIRALFGE